MATKMQRIKNPNPPPAGWTIHEEWQLSPRRRLDKNSIVKVRGWTASYRFVRAITNAQGAVWLDLIGLGQGEGQRLWRSVEPSRITKVVQQA